MDRNSISVTQFFPSTGDQLVGKCKPLCDLDEFSSSSPAKPDTSLPCHAFGVDDPDPVSAFGRLDEQTRHEQPFSILDFEAG
jgi:hypothetical protein